MLVHHRPPEPGTDPVRNLLRDMPSLGALFRLLRRRLGALAARARGLRRRPARACPS